MEAFYSEVFFEVDAIILTFLFASSISELVNITYHINSIAINVNKFYTVTIILTFIQKNYMQLLKESCGKCEKEFQTHNLVRSVSTNENTRVDLKCMLTRNMV